MINLSTDKPTDELHGRSLYNTKFVDEADIAHKNILDIGCGFGWMELNLLTRGAAKIIGTEMNEKGLESAKKDILDPRVNFVVGNALALPFSDNNMDTIISWEVIEHVPKETESKMFSEAHRVLKSGGAFYLSTPFNSFPSKIFDPAWWLIGHRHYSPEKLIAIAENNGFQLAKTETHGGWWEIMGINNLYIAKWIFRRRPFFINLFTEKIDAEYSREKGFTSLFLKFIKK